MELEKLSPYACKSVNSKGRKVNEEKCDIRTDFARDRDRINHCKSFRRLMHKTQVFISPEGDHYRTRLTHTLEVTQISRTIARALRLNEDLTEAVAFGHDLGHTPFGHTGENALNIIMAEGFKHNRQSVRTVEYLENNGKGLNLTYEVIDGILNHRGTGTPITLEGKVVQISDKIAYVNHDIDDAIRAGALKQEDLPKDCLSALGETSKERIDFLIRNVIKNSIDTDYVSLEEDVKDIFMQLRKFMFSTVYSAQLQQEEREKIKRLIADMFGYYTENLNKLPDDYRKMTETQGINRVVCDYIAGMTDRFAINQYRKIFLPNSWSL